MFIKDNRRVSFVSKQTKNSLNESLEKAISLTRGHSAITRYSLAVLLSIFFIVLKISLDPLIGSLTPFIFIFPAVLISAWFGGIGPGAVATILTVLGIAYFFLAPGRQLHLINLTNLLELVVYIVEATIVIFVVHWRNKAYSALSLRAAQQSIIAAISQYGVGGDLTTFLDNVVRSIAHTLNADFCQLFEILPDGKRMRLQSGFGLKKGILRKAVLSAEDNSLLDYTFRSRKPIIIKDLANDRRFRKSSIFVDQGVVSGINVLIPGTNGPYGVLSIFTKTRRDFSKHDAVFLQTIANVIAAAIERYESRQALELLAVLSTYKVATFDPQKILGGLVRLIVPLFADFCEVYITHAKRKVELLEIESSSREKQRILQEIAQKYPPPTGKAKSISASVLHSGKPKFIPYITSKLEEEITADEQHLRLQRSLQLQSVIAIPLRIRSRIIGVATFGTFQKGRIFRERDFRIAKEIAERIAVAIDNAMLYQETREAVKARDEFLSIASHELKTPLTSMLLQLQSVLHSIKNQSLATFSIERTMQMLESTINQSKRLGKLVNDLLNYSLISTGRLQLEKEKTQLDKIASDVVSRFAEQAKKTSTPINLFLENSVTGNWDRVRLEQVVTNLITNAIKYGAGKPVEVLVKDSKYHATLIVRDHGIGIPQDQQRKVFDRFERGSIKGGYKGLGVGLYIVNQIVQAHGGKIALASKPKEGTTFTIELPK